MKTNVFLNLLLSVALVIISFNMLQLKNTARTDDGANPEQAVIDNIMTRTSIRQYTGEKLSDKQIETLLRAGMAAPSAGNKQPWRMVVVQDKKVQQLLADSIQPAKAAAGAAALIVVCGDLDETFPGDGCDYWVEDCSAVAENILLAAHALKLGAVWLGVYPKGDRCALVKKLLQLPQNIMPLGMMAVGYPAEDPAPKDKWKPENVHYGVWGGKNK